MRRGIIRSIKVSFVGILLGGGLTLATVGLVADILSLPERRLLARHNVQCLAGHLMREVQNFSDLVERPSRIESMLKVRAFAVVRVHKSGASICAVLAEVSGVSEKELRDLRRLNASDRYAILRTTETLLREAFIR